MPYIKVLSVSELASELYDSGDYTLGEANALATYLDEYADGDTVTLDFAAIRGAYSVYGGATEAYEDISGDDPDSLALAWLADNTLGVSEQGNYIIVEQ